MSRNHQHPCAENRRLRRSWRSERDSNRDASVRDFGNLFLVGSSTIGVETRSRRSNWHVRYDSTTEILRNDIPSNNMAVVLKPLVEDVRQSRKPPSCSYAG